MIPPSKDNLKAMAGWAITARDNCSDKQKLALYSFQDGCGELAEVIDDIKPLKTAKPQPVPLPQHPHVQHVSRVPDEVAVMEHHRLDQFGQCIHKFDIATQRCRYCGRTYLDVMKRKPELM